MLAYPRQIIDIQLDVHSHQAGQMLLSLIQISTVNHLWATKRQEHTIYVCGDVRDERSAYSCQAHQRYVSDLMPDSSGADPRPRREALQGSRGSAATTPPISHAWKPANVTFCNEKPTCSTLGSTRLVVFRRQRFPKYNGKLNSCVRFLQQIRLKSSISHLKRGQLQSPKANNLPNRVAPN